LCVNKGGNGDSLSRQLARILDEHGPAAATLLLRLTLRRDVVEELMQELFIKLSSSPDKAWQTQNPAAYVRRAAINLAMDWRRRRVRQIERESLIEADSLVTQQPLVGQELESQEEISQILDAAGSLSELAQQAFILHFVQQESYERVGQILGKTTHQARALCHASVSQIRDTLAHRERQATP